MNIGSATHAPAVAAPASAAQGAGATKAPAPPRQLTAADVPASLVRAANADGDGRFGTAALNDGDAAAQAARRAATDVKA